MRAREKRALLLAFGAFGSFWGAWAALLPAIRDDVGVDDGQLGLALAAIAATALPAMPFAGRLVDRLGAGRLLRRSLLAFAAAVPLAALADGLLGLVLALALLGATTGVLDVVVNTATAAWERIESARLMAAGHGCFSVGVLVGSVSTGVARDLGATPGPVLLTTALLLAAAAVTVPDLRRAATSEATSPAAERRAVPHGDVTDRGAARLSAGGVVLVLGLLVGCSFLAEDALISWSALHLERGLGAPPWVGGLGPGLFAGAMAMGRFGVHLVGDRVGEARVVACGGAAVAAGALLLAAAPGPGLGLTGLVVAGAGTSVLAPTLFSAVGARSAPGRQGADLARVSAIGYAGFVAGPPIVGILSELTSLPVALGSLSLLGLVLVLAGPPALRAGSPALQR